MSEHASAGPDERARPRRVRIRVSVHGPGGAGHVEPVEVSLIGSAGRRVLEQREGLPLYEGSIEEGRYTLRVRGERLEAPDRDLEVTAGGRTASVYLGARGWPRYRLGENVVPFEPRDDVLAVTFDVHPPERERAQALVERLSRDLPVEPLDFDPQGELPFAAAEGAIWLLRLIDPNDRERIADAVRRLVGGHVRVGMPVDLTRGQVKVIDNRFVVRFRDHLKPEDIEELARSADATVGRSFIQAGNARLIAFRGGDYRRHLQIVERWLDEGLLVYGEPDIVAELTDDQFPATPPNDPAWPQANLALQNVDDAWQFVNGLDPNLTLGSPAVHVATIDRGVQLAHPDVGGNLTDGSPQLAQCYDFRFLQACTAPGYATDTSHGMGVYGIVAARTNNALAVAGIAPNSHQLGLKRPTTFTTSIYPDCLLWAAGFTTGNPAADWPPEPIGPGADIISCSHGVDGLALSGLMDDTLTYLATYGRGGRGTIVVYSAGNSNQLITGFRVWAAHPRALGIANSMQPDAGGVERKDPTSNFGPEIDICAQGTNAPSLDDTGGQQVFGGTSAAAPTVAAAAALMLAAEPSLTWIDVRDILRATAVVIDPANTDPAGQWVGGFSQWYGFGRLDAAAAVGDADGFDPSAISLLLRDNLADTGATVPTGGTFWRSPDIWVRNTDPAGDPDPGYMAEPPHDPATFGADNWIRVRVKNVGTAASRQFWVRAYVTHFAGTEFRYPTDFIPSINTGDPIPSPLVPATYAIGEQLLNGLAANATQILTFVWPVTLVPPEFVAGTRWHVCLLAEVSPHTGPAPSGELVVDHASLAQRNITVAYSDDGPISEATGVIGHEDNREAIKRIVVHRARLPKRAEIWVRFLDRRVEKAVVERLRSQPTTGVKLAQRDGMRMFRLAFGSRLVIDVPMVSGPLTPVVLGASLPDDTPTGAYELPLTELDGCGRVAGAFALEVVVAA